MSGSGEPNYRVDERKRYSKVKLIDGSVLEGDFFIDLGAGHLQSGLVPFVMDGEVVVPLTAVLLLTPSN